MKFHIKTILFFFLVNCCAFSFAQEINIPKAPHHINPVNDYAHVLSNSAIASLNQKLMAYRDSTSTEILVVTITSTNNADINFMATRWGEEWHIGQKEKNNGVVILIATEDHKLAISTGRGSEGALTDMVCKTIITDYMVPELKNGDYHQSINIGTDKIFLALKGEFKAEPKKLTFRDCLGWFMAIIFAIIAIGIIFFPILAFFAFATSGTYSSGGHSRGYRSGGFGGGGSFGGGGGGGSSFGSGGSFGGGGSSGSW